MTHLEFIAAKNIKGIQDWRRAKIGSLLQVGELPQSGTPKAPVIVFRFDNTTVTNGPGHSILAIENERAGFIYPADPARGLPALDVSALVEIGVANAMPRPLIKAASLGDLVVITNGEPQAGTACFIVAGYPQGGFAGYVCVGSTLSTYKLGEIVQNVDGSKLIMPREIANSDN